MKIDNRQLTIDHSSVTALTLFLFALILRVVIVVFWQFDGLYGQDAFAYLQQGLAIAENIPRAELPPQDFFWPNGYPALIAIFTLFFNATPLAAQSVSLLCGALLAPLIYALTVALFPRLGQMAGVLAGLIVAIAGMPITSSIVIMADMPALMWATLAVWLVVLAAKTSRGEGWFLASAGAAIGLAIVSRWAYVLLVPALIGFVLLNIWQKKINWWAPLFAVLAGLVLLVPQILLSLNRPEGLLHSWLLGWQPLNAFLRQFEHIDGFYNYWLPVGLFYLQPAGHPAYIFPLLGLAALWAIWLLWQTRNGAAAILLLGWLGAVYFFLAGIPYQNFRFGLTLYPPLVVLAAVGVSDVWHRVGQQRFWRFIGASVIAFSLIGMLVWSYRTLDSFITLQNDSKRIVEQVEAILPSDATLMTFGLTLTFQHYSLLDTREFFYCDEAALDAVSRIKSPLYFLLNVPNIEQQWLGRTPHINYQWLHAKTHLQEIQIFPPYTLFKLERPDAPPPNVLAARVACTIPLEAQVQE